MKFKMPIEQVRARAAFRLVLWLVAGFVGLSGLSGCLVAGYSSRGGGFIWPGGFGMVILVVVLWLLMRRR